MKIRNRGLRLAVSVALMSAATAILWYIKSAGIGSHHVYLYLLPVILVRIFCGTRLSMFWTAIAIVLGNYFLQDPAYTFYNDNPLEYGDLVCFAILAVTAIKSMPSRRERKGSRFPIARSAKRTRSVILARARAQQPYRFWSRSPRLYRRSIIGASERPH
jgi:K+-sensing histidine kinase KdpD